MPPANKRVSTSAAPPSAPGDLPFTDLEAEEWVIGSCVASNEILERVRLVLEPRDIFRGWNRRVYEAALAVADAGEDVEIGSVTLYLANAGEWDHRTDTAQLIGLLNQVPNPHNAPYYAKRVEEVAALRRLVQAGSKVAEAAYEAKGNAEEGIKAARTLFDQMTVRRQQSTFTEMGALMSAYYDHVDQITNGSNPASGVLTGFTDLDRLLGGLQRTDLVIVAARPGVGKTSLALSIAMHAAQSSHGVGMVSLEMSKMQVSNRLVAMRAHLDGNAIRTNKLCDDEWTRFNGAIGHLSTLPICIDDTPGITGADLRGKTAALCARNDIDLLVLDYLQLMGTTGTRDNRQQEISDISRTCKAIARQHNVPFLVVSQLNRQVESRTDHIPQLSDLRDSGQIEQDADVVLFLHREREAGSGPSDGSQPYPVRVTVAKQRSGPTGELDLMFVPRWTLFQTIERRHTGNGSGWVGSEVAG